jgi:glycerophosphoryl diester phosphodiesterase
MNRIAGSATLILLLSSLPTLASEPVKGFPFFEPIDPPRKLQVMVHRGMMSQAPENTRRALEMCIEDGYEWVEVDVRLSKDGKHILCHDARLDGKTNGKGLVKDKTTAELLDLDAGAWFARRFTGTCLLSLEQALKLARGRINLYLDCKDIDPERLVKDITTAGMERQVVVYHNPATIARIRTLSRGKVATMTKWRPASGLERWVMDVKPSAVEIDASDVSAEVCRKFRARGIKVQAKTLGSRWDRPEVWEKVIAAGVDWIQTDHPLEVRMHDLRKRQPKWPVQIAYHRGANRYAPENTLPAIERAARLGADYIEIDIRTTRDGKQFLMHDRSVTRTTRARGNLADLTADQVAKLDAGTWFGKPFAGVSVPTLEDGLKAMGDKSHAYLDAKDIPVEKLAKLLEERKLLDRSVVYQSVDYLRKLKKLQPRARLLPPLKRVGDLEALIELKPYGVDASWRILSKELIDRCHAKGIRVFSDSLFWYENIPAYRRAMSWGIDVIQTDQPARVLRAIELVGVRK